MTTNDTNDSSPIIFSRKSWTDPKIPIKAKIMAAIVLTSWPALLAVSVVVALGLSAFMWMRSFSPNVKAQRAVNPAPTSQSDDHTASL